MNEFNSSQRIGDIAAKFPNVVEIYKENKIDFCCGGDRPLKKAIEELSLNEQELINRINSSYEQFKNQNLENKDWVSAPIDELVDHIINTHHAYLYVNLPKISELTTAILRAHGQNHPELSKVHKLFHSLKMELDSHLIKEETIQYPAIDKYLKTKDINDLENAIDVIKSLEEEHVGAGDVLKELRIITEDYKVPSDGCPTYQLTFDKLVELESDMFQHIHLENNILFPRLKALRTE